MIPSAWACCSSRAYRSFSRARTQRSKAESCSLGNGCPRGVKYERRDAGAGPARRAAGRDLRRLPDRLHADHSVRGVRLHRLRRHRVLPDGVSDHRADEGRDARRRAVVHFHGARARAGGADGTPVQVVPAHPRAGARLALPGRPPDRDDLRDRDRHHRRLRDGNGHDGGARHDAGRLRSEALGRHDRRRAARSAS